MKNKLIGCKKTLENLEHFVRDCEDLKPSIAGRIRAHINSCNNCQSNFLVLSRSINGFSYMNEFIDNRLREASRISFGPVVKTETQRDDWEDCVRMNAFQEICNLTEDLQYYFGEEEEFIEAHEEKAIILDALYEPAGEIFLKRLMAPQINKEPEFKAVYATEEKELENRILAITIDFPKEELTECPLEYNDITFISPFKRSGEGNFLEASFTILGNFECPGNIDEKNYRLYIWPEGANI